MIPCEKVKINFYGYNHQMQFMSVVTASYTLGFLMTKIPWLVVRLKHEISKQKFLEFSFMEKMLIIQFHSMEKMLIIQFHIRKKCLFWYFHTYTFTLWNCMKEYDKHFFHRWKLYDKLFLSTREVTHLWNCWRIRSWWRQFGPYIWAD